MTSAAAIGAATMADGLSGCSVIIQTKPPPIAPSKPLLAKYAKHPYVDAHCHVFNASDLPLNGFLREVLLNRDDVVQAFKKAFVGKIADIFDRIQIMAPSACEENASLSTIKINYPGRGGAWDKFDKANLLEYISRVGHSDHLQLILGAAANKAGDDEAVIARDEVMVALHKFQKGTLSGAKVVQAVLDAPAGSHCRQYLIWLIKLARPRHELLYELDTLATDAGAIDQFRIFAPAIIDYDCWLDNSSTAVRDAGGAAGFCSTNVSHTKHRSLISEQVLVMSKIARLQPAGKVVLPFVPFDPLRATIDELEPKGPSPLKIVADAIQKYGFIGVKLYPPMGFWPIGNGDALREKIDGLNWGTAKTYLGNIVPTWGRLTFRYSPYTLGDAFDRVLRELYNFCYSNDVPIMAHCSRSQYSFPQAASRGAPNNWKKLLNSLRYPDDPSQGTFQGLRLNLAHFGGPWCLGLKDTNDKSLPDVCETHNRKQWSEDAMDLLKTGAYPNLFFDVADWNNVLSDPNGTRTAFKRLAERATENPVIAQRLMYGTDWSLLAQYGDVGTYADRLYAELQTAVGDDKAKDIMGCNALRFFGLIGDCGAGPTFTSNARNRLQEFYGSTSEKWRDLSDYLDGMCNAPS